MLSQCYYIFENVKSFLTREWAKENVWCTKKGEDSRSREGKVILMFSWKIVLLCSVLCLSVMQFFLLFLFLLYCQLYAEVCVYPRGCSHTSWPTSACFFSCIAFPFMAVLGVTTLNSFGGKGCVISLVCVQSISKIIYKLRFIGNLIN